MPLAFDIFHYGSDNPTQQETLGATYKSASILEDGKKWWVEKERDLERAYINCKVLPHVPRESEIKELFLSCLEAHYGTLTAAVIVNPDIDNLVKDLENILEKYKR